jgi:class 3 adenylate cyclase/tetratricopeptide (TPR) repeat protein
VKSCSSCGAELAPLARFCPYCGTPADAPPPTQERRIVTVLFVDLVGFTERSDKADPEDVRYALVPFHRLVRDELERFGGTLDKFIGDAVMGIFGAPIAHDDDPVRAVRAGLRILEGIGDMRRQDPDLAVRVALNTGEAFVSFGSGPQIGEAVAGDVVNTASRMQSVAPRGSLVIGPTTLEGLGGRFDVEELPPAVVKGKSEPLQLWRVVGERAGAAPEETPFVGRREELASLSEAFDEVASGQGARTVVVLGEPGVGKSRLVAELVRSVGTRAVIVEGSAPSAGEQLAYAPIRDTIRTLAGLGLAEDDETFLGRLDALVARDDGIAEERRFVASTLATAIGLVAPTREAAIPPAEVAEAWASVLAAQTGRRPLVVALHDIHRADASFIEVLDATLERLGSHRVLVVVTARPELPDNGPTLVEDRPGRRVLWLGPLDDDATIQLLGAVLVDEMLPSAARRRILDRSGGNPLYAIEFGRMLADADAGASVADATATPVSVQAVISARLDAIPAEARAVLLDASVVGDEVWVEACASVGDRDVAEVSTAVEVLERRGMLVRRASSLPAHDAFAFSNALVREVAYARLPRAVRAGAHLRAGRWLEAAAGERADEWAELLAQHHAAAAELGASANDTAVVEAAREPALRWLLAAGDRAARVDPSAGFVLFRRALALAPPDGRQREDALWRYAISGRRSGMVDGTDVLASYEEGLALARARGATEDVGSWLTRCGSQLAALGESDRARAAFAEAIETLEALAPGRPLALAYAFRAEEELFAGDTAEALGFADRALALVGERTDDVAVMSLHIRGDARCSTGDLEGGLDDLETALRLAQEIGSSIDVITSRNYLAEWRAAVQGPAAGIAELEAALELAERRNVTSQGAYSRANAIHLMVDAGDWDRALAWADELTSMPPERVDPVVVIMAELCRSRIQLARGARDGVADPDELVEAAERVEELHALAPALVAAAQIALRRGDAARAASLIERFEAATDGVAPEYRAAEIVRAVRTAVEAGRVDLAERLLAGTEPRVPRDGFRLTAARAILAEALGDGAASAYAASAEELQGYGDVYEEALARRAHARLTGDDASRARADELFSRLGVSAGP